MQHRQPSIMSSTISPPFKKPIYKKTSAYGHFGRRDVDFSWEKTDKAEALQSIRVN